MSAVWQIILALGSVGVLVGVMALIRQLAPLIGISPEMQRKLIHVFTGIYALSWPWLFPDRWPAYMLVGVTLVVLVVLRLPKTAKGVGAALHGVDRRSYGDILLAISVGLCLFLAGEDQLYLYVLPIAVLTFADAAAALVGTHYGRRRFKVEDGTKSVEGCVTFFMVTLVIALITLLALTGLPPVKIIVISLILAFFGALVEAASWRGFDNLFLPLGLLIVLNDAVNSTLPQLGVLAGLFAVTLIAFRILSERLGIGLHVSRVYVTMIFVLLSATSYPNALTPILVLATHLWARRANPGEDRFPDLDIVAALTLASLGWLALGRAFGANAISFYGMTAMGMAAALSAIALMRRPPQGRIIGMALVIAALCMIRFWVVSVNPPIQNWNGAMWGGVVATLLVSSLPVAIWPDLFRRDRVTRVTLLALMVPVAIYLGATKMLGLLA